MVHDYNDTSNLYLDEIFEKWTKGGFRENDARVKIFENIRDIPYRCVEFTEPSVLIRKNAGNCFPKHILLSYFFNKLGIQTRYAVCSFNWGDFNIFPTELRRKSIKIGSRTHLFINALIDARWIVLDATWDMNLKKLGFNVNEWDGTSNTSIAVSPLSEIKILEKPPQKKPHSQQQKEFYEEFNNWLITNSIM